jgi:hypothetical protein
MAERSRQSSVASRQSRPRTTRLAIGRVRLGSLARVGFSIGWIVSLLPSLFTSAVVAWVLHGIWNTLDGWTPWSPWSPDTSILGVRLPSPEFAPREALRLEGLYQRLEPIGHHPFIGAIVGTLVLTILGGLVFTAILTLAGLAYNLFATITGGIEFELNERPSRGSTRTPRSRTSDTDEWDEAELRW